MNIEEVKKLIKDTLTSMGCEDIAITSVNPNKITAVFNCKEITSFVTYIPGWIQSGIQLNASNGHQYNIEFYKTP